MGNSTPYCAEGKAALTHANDVPTPGKLNIGYGEGEGLAFNVSLTIFFQKIKLHFLAPKESNYWIVNTDYQHYSVVYHCNSIGKNKSLESAWVFGRDRILDVTTQNTIDEIVNKTFERSALRVQNQKE